MMMSISLIALLTPLQLRQLFFVFQSANEVRQKYVRHAVTNGLYRRGMGLLAVNSWAAVHNIVRPSALF